MQGDGRITGSLPLASPLSPLPFAKSNKYNNFDNSGSYFKEDGGGGTRAIQEKELGFTFIRSGGSAIQGGEV